MRRAVSVIISQQEYDLLSAIGKPENVLASLADHAAQGIRRTGAWESGWIRQCVGYDFEKNLEVDPTCKGKVWTNMRTKGTPGQRTEEP